MTDLQSPRPPEEPGAHRLRPMSGRDPHEVFRVATPLELLFDLTFVVAFGTAASEFAHMLAEDHVVAGLLAFGFSTFAVWWAWINFSKVGGVPPHIPTAPTWAFSLGVTSV